MQINNERQMMALGAKIGTLLKGGEVIELVGDVGAGKTTFVKGLAAGLAIDEDIQSPSFTINRTYTAPNGLYLSHYDFYRLHDAGITGNELQDALQLGDTALVIEWADIVQGILPTDRLTIRITAPGENTRLLVCEAGGPLSHALIGAIQ